jgi:outer membrane protein assembly factor BamB
MLNWMHRDKMLLRCYAVRWASQRMGKLEMRTIEISHGTNMSCIVCIATSLFCLTAPIAASAQVDVLTNHNDREHTSATLSETELTPANVNARQFGMLFKRVVDDQVYSQPLLATNVKIAGGWHDVVYVTTVNNSVYAFDANDAAATAPLWHVNFGTPASVNDANFGCTDINDKMGIIGTPVIDPEKTTLYVVALTKAGGGFFQRLHALDLTTGADLPNSPTTIDGPGFDPLMQNQRTALVLSGGNVLIGYASHCDKDPYHGFLFGYDQTSLNQVGVFNTSLGGEGASIWQSGQAPSVDEKGDIYFITGNGSWNGTTQFSESFIKLDTDMHLLDWFTPTNHLQLDKDDNDLNSSGAVLIPGTHLVIGGGKEGVLYSIDTEHLGHLGDEHAVQHFRVTSSHLHSMVYWKSARNGDVLYLWGQRDRARAYRLVGNKFEETPFMIRPDINDGHPGAMLSLSASGGKNGILWAAIHATGDSWNESRPGILHAYDADDINHELWNSLLNPRRDDCNNYSKMAPPTVANGKVYLASFGTENVGTGQLCVYGLLPNGPPPEAPIGVRAINKGRFVEVSWRPVPEAKTYTVVCTLGSAHRVVSGLTRPELIDPGINTGVVQYVVRAVNANGQSIPSATARAAIDVAPTRHRMKMN